MLARRKTPAAIGARRRSRSASPRKAPMRSGTPRELDLHVKAERARFAKLLKAIGLKDL